MKLTIYHIDAFTRMLFRGNPAAVIPLEAWLDDQLMQNIAAENNLSETVFFVPLTEGEYEIRWFAPTSEINLCGHATLASAYVLHEHLAFNRPALVFHSKSGKLQIERQDATYVMDFPSWKPERIQTYPGNLRKALGVNEILGIFRNRDMIVELPSARDVEHAKPDFSAMIKWNEKVIITAPGDEGVDFVSRFFAPSIGINEDPVTGSAHSQLIPFWSDRLGRKKMIAKQLSARGGDLVVEDCGARVKMAGECVFYMKGEIEV